VMCVDGTSSVLGTLCWHFACKRFVLGLTRWISSSNKLELRPRQHTNYVSGWSERRHGQPECSTFLKRLSDFFRGLALVEGVARVLPRRRKWSGTIRTQTTRNKLSCICSQLQNSHATFLSTKLKFILFHDRTLVSLALHSGTLTPPTRQDVVH